MTSNEMRRLFFLLRDGDAVVEREFDDREVGSWLTKAQEEYIKRGMFNSPSLEEGSNRDSELYQLKTHDSIIGTTFTANTKYENAYSTQLFANYLYNLSESADITYKGTQYKRVPIKAVNEDAYNEFNSSPLHRPWRRLLWRVTEQGLTKELILIVDEDTTIDKYYTSYVRRPEDIVVDIINTGNQAHCELDATVHRDIVELAVRMSQASTGSPKYQLSLNEERN